MTGWSVRTADSSNSKLLMPVASPQAFELYFVKLKYVLDSQKTVRANDHLATKKNPLDGPPMVHEGAKRVVFRRHPSH